MIEHNVYFDGKVQSLGFQCDSGEATVGVCEPGTYTVPTDEEEHLTFLSGTGRVKLPDQDWRAIKAGDVVIAAAGVEVTWEIAPGANACYFCVFR